MTTQGLPLWEPTQTHILPPDAALTIHGSGREQRMRPTPAAERASQRCGVLPLRRDFPIRLGMNSYFLVHIWFFNCFERWPEMTESKGDLNEFHVRRSVLGSTGSGNIDFGSLSDHFRGPQRGGHRQVGARRRR